jgi:hypothetical protein
MGITVVSTQRLNQIPHSVDLLLCACGYESRSTYLPKMLADRATRRVAIGFDSQHELRYDENAQWFYAHGFEVSDATEGEYNYRLRQIFAELCASTRNPSIVVDISCLNRARLAKLVRALQEMDSVRADVAFVYNLAEFSPPAEDMEPTSVAEPVIPEFAGWTNYPERPPAAILGLGYEQSRAIGIVDHLEINNAAWAFVPRGPITEYSNSVDLANRSLFDMISVEGRKLFYDVMNPGVLFHELNALVDSLKHIYNPILIPFGPKLFALVGLLVASMHEEIGVWRVSSGALQVPVDRTPSRYTTVLRAFIEN